jgi:hypothetical protein
MQKYKRDSGWGHRFAPFMFHCRHPWAMGFPRRKDYLHMLEAYKEELEEMQRAIAEEIEELAREIEDLKG